MLGYYDNLMSQRGARNIVFVVFDDVHLLDIAGAADVFAIVDELNVEPAYKVSFVARSEGPPRNCDPPEQ